jgi:dihydroorotate dehydrogenase (NAD+) catalytic subunit
VIELAPNRKQGLTLANPLIAATGAIGFASEAADLLALDRFGALVTSAISLHPRRGSTPPRCVAVRGGFLLRHDAHNPGWRSALTQFGSAWARSKAPLVIHLVGRTSLSELARQVENAGSFAAIEVDLAGEDSLPFLVALRAASELPLLVRLRASNAIALGPLAVQAGADALVCVAPPQGTALDRSTGQYVDGDLFGPLVRPLALKALRDVLAVVQVPLIACGGVHAREDVDEFLAAGASAVMVDSLAWIDPAAVNQMLLNAEA